MASHVQAKFESTFDPMTKTRLPANEQSLLSLDFSIRATPTHGARFSDIYNHLHVYWTEGQRGIKRVTDDLIFQQA